MNVVLQEGHIGVFNVIGFKMKKTRKITFCSMAAALIVSFFFLTSFLNITASIAGICGIIIYLVNLMFGYKYSFLVYLISSIISLIISPGKSAVILYIIFFGIYPTIYVLLNFIKNKFLKSFIKISVLLIFSIILNAIYSFAFDLFKTQNKILFLGSTIIFLLLTFSYNLTLIYFNVYYNNILKNKFKKFFN